MVENKQNQNSQTNQSPGLNHIENTWHVLKTNIRNRPNNIRNLKELKAALKEEWNKIPQNVLMNLIKRRVEACIKARAGQSSISLIHRFRRS